MATLEEIKPYLDRRIGLCAHICLDHMVNYKNSPNGQEYSFQDFYIYPSKESGYYRLDVPDFETPYDQKVSRPPRQELLVTWPEMMRRLASFSCHPYDKKKDYLETDKWRLDVYKPRRPQKGT